VAVFLMDVSSSYLWSWWLLHFSLLVWCPQFIKAHLFTARELLVSGRK